jgi:hypothetical protein
MIALARTALRTAGADAGALYQRLSARSIDAAVREQGLAPLREELRRIVPDLSGQYTHAMDAEEYARYWERKARGLHAFQVQCALDALDRIDGDGKVIVDIGDSSGHHATYLRALAPTDKIVRIVGVNLDPVAVDKIRSRGGEAVLARAEEVSFEGISPDLVLSFETLEHLTDPLRFLHRLATESSARHLLVSVPYRRTSRFGGQLLRKHEEWLPSRLTPEETHLFELAADDWRLLAHFAGYRTVFMRRYLQYPLRHPLRVMAPLWRRLDFEGFIALFLERDLGLARRYTGW